jgi:hypothetical protein
MRYTLRCSLLVFLQGFSVIGLDSKARSAESWSGTIVFADVGQRTVKCGSSRHTHWHKSFVKALTLDQPARQFANCSWSND